MDQVPRLGKRELVCPLLFTCNYVVSVGEVSTSSGCFGWATLFYCGTPWGIIESDARSIGVHLRVQQS